MSSAGHVLDMIKRQKDNRALQKRRRSSLEERMDTPKSNMKYNPAFKKEFSAEERTRIDQKIREDIRRERFRSLSIGLLALTVLVALYYLVLQPAIL